MKKPFVHDITGIDPVQAFLAVKHMPYSLFLDSADRKHPSSRYSFVMCQPIETIEAKDGKITVTNWEQRLSFDGQPFAVLQSRIKAWVENAETVANMPPFQGGAAGLFGYDLGRYVEDLPDTAQSDNKVPDMAVGIYDQVLAHDYLMKKTYIFTHAHNENEANTKRAHFIDLITRDVEPPPYQSCALDWQSNFDKGDYIDTVKKVIDYIYDGDIFQANLSQRFTAQTPKDFDPFIHYMHLRAVNPAPFATYMNLGDVKISSASPERFVTVKNKKVETSPIKGTRPRVADIIQDRANKNDLLSNEKDMAENTMIVDLLRNDLSKVCTPDSVEVVDLCKLESFVSVHHLVSHIRGQLTYNKGAIDLLRACFPGGSITGAPKIRAMEILEELEGIRRAAYCGSIGYIGFDDNMDTNILIRTLVYESRKISLQVGGGIVADSDPLAEYQETLDKAAAMFGSFKTDDQANTSSLSKAG
tara:strand:+ start:33387 stop:34805 length:1419 start_codon:yes stop_codon:yes gene_type:complete